MSDNLKEKIEQPIEEEVTQHKHMDRRLVAVLFVVFLYWSGTLTYSLITQVF